MRSLPIMLVSASILIALPASAQTPNQPITKREPDAVDIATTPVGDLNLRKDEIPEILIEAQESPYDLTGLKRCDALITRINALDVVLGPDIDLQQDEAQRISAGRVAQSVVGSLIPFRGLVREISGANRQERLIQSAILAGIAQRAFLKGVGETKGCRYPARSATPDAIARYQEQEKIRRAANQKAEENAEKAETDKKVATQPSPAN